MKSKNLFRLAFLALAIAGLSLAGCKKDKNPDLSADSSSLQQLSGDEISMESALDESMNDVNNFLSGEGLKSTSFIPCNATVDSTATINDSITYYITYNGLNCSQTRFRTGKVEVQMQVGTQWIQQGATVIIRHINFTITKVSNQKTITLNGVKVHKNVSGGLIPQLGTGGITQVVHRTWGHVNVTFSDTTTRIWNIARQKTYSGHPPDSLVLTTDGFGISEGLGSLVVWGINRKGENFYTQIIQPVVHRQVCDWDPCAGVKKHSIPADSKSATLTFGYDGNNQLITGDECPVKYKVDWQKNNHSGTVYLLL
ncbi:MAG: hypothetical protein NT040_00540 [Bacteroidetes bacterium]|nr:hypothetical protein [Bacteroidota bacterium]